MKLVIAEKPSVARGYAAAMGAREKGNGCIKGNGYIFTWCYGHLVETAQPEDYDESLKRWSIDALPIVPQRWKFKPIKSGYDQYKVVKALMNDASVDEIIVGTDAGREGELIFRRVYEMAGCKKPFKRLWLSSMEDTAIRRGFASLKDGRLYDPLYRAADCRQKADWLVGINYTRLFTRLYDHKIGVGRVQTPTLAMIAEREKEIAGFKKEPFWTVHLIGEGIDAASEKFMSKAAAEAAASACAGKDAKVASVSKEKKSAAPPKLYDLTTLQRDANRLFGYTAKETLDLVQQLYEKKLATYPRTDSQYLSDDMEATALEAVRVSKGFLGYADAAPVDAKRLLDSRKVTDHHAIIPTAQISRIKQGDLTEDERRVLSLIAYRLVCSTGERHEYEAVKAVVACGEVKFAASGKTTLKEGWKRHEKEFRAAFKAAAEDKQEEPMPALAEGQTITRPSFKVAEGATQPPKRFTEDTLLAAMERAGAKEMSEDVERKGLGTTATRAEIIEKLIRSGFVARQKKQLIPTEDGMKAIELLPEKVKSPMLTAEWENRLARIAKGEGGPEDFISGIEEMVRSTVAEYKRAGAPAGAAFSVGSEALGECPKCGGAVVKGKFGPYCKGRCGMSLGYAFGKKLTDAQVKSLLTGKRTLVKGLKSKKGTDYDAYLTPTGLEEYSYEARDGGAAKGCRFKFKMDFPENKRGKG